MSSSEPTTQMTSAGMLHVIATSLCNVWVDQSKALCAPLFYVHVRWPRHWGIAWQPLLYGFRARGFWSCVRSRRKHVKKRPRGGPVRVSVRELSGPFTLTLVGQLCGFEVGGLVSLNRVTHVTATTVQCRGSAARRPAVSTSPEPKGGLGLSFHVGGKQGGETGFHPLADRTH